MSLTQLSKEIYQEAKARGLWDEPETTARSLFRIISEVNEALDADEKRRYANLKKFEAGAMTIQDFEELMKNTFQDEMADILKITLSIIGMLNMDIDPYFRHKRAYNKLRPR
jgi:NTP pyrophosphatase (non-canonical NTP hydrolase)